ncbi:hypothetical protein Q4610_13155 [Sphingobium sp. HBC34]|uniref:Secreted protein n=1 Tax=Sphingobium cyanobacteriorum TaxID=3063954 RepID=A0ABT8ZN82_9SPHN|nr:hypothetical protein [Sphingobium sp. HBC34]MDO7835994.1 hypothetical protein [Sphingobium sp. HBC34]
MRSSAALLAGLACFNLAIAATPVAAADGGAGAAAGRPIAFCGTPPPGWVPPGRKRPAPQMPGGLCHVMLCGTEKSRGRSR